MATDVGRSELSNATGPVIIRPVGTADVEPVLEVWRAANRERGVDSPPEHEAAVRAQLERARTTALVCVEPDGRVLGFVTGEERVIDGTEVPGATQLLALFVAPAAQGRGVGTQLMHALTADARHRGRPELHLWVRSSNAGARRLYERYGFTAAGDEIMDGDVALTAYVRPPDEAVS